MTNFDFENLSPIRWARIKAGLTQEEMGKFLNITQAGYARYEGNQLFPSHHVRRIAGILGFPVEKIGRTFPNVGIPTEKCEKCGAIVEGNDPVYFKDGEWVCGGCR